MCGIAGILSKKGENVVPLVSNMLSCMINRGPDGAGLAAGSSIFTSASLADLELEKVSDKSAFGHTRLAIVGGTCGQQPFKSCDGRLTLEHNGEIYNYKKIRKRLESRHAFQTYTDSEVVVHLLEENLEIEKDMLKAISKTVEELDGVYAFAIKDESTGTIVLVRDKVGVRQLYYGENQQYIAFASERKALWKVGIKEPTRCILPAHALFITKDGTISQLRVSSLPLKAPKRMIKEMDKAVRAYQNALLSSMKKRTQDFERVGIIFSGGIDSVIVACLAKKLVPEVICYTAGLKGSNDIAFARKIAKSLDLKLRVNELTQDEVEEMIPEVINTIEETNSGQVEVAIPVYAAVKLAHEDGIKVMFTGQGADELFGGYSWYSKVIEKESYEKLREHMNEDILLLYKETLEREDKITMAHSIEMREPFLDINLIKVSMSIDPRLFIRNGADNLGKRVHRKVAENIGIPRSIAYRIKEAAQHGSGIHDTVKSIAEKHGFDKSTVSRHYEELLGSREKLGSSQRYGYLFDNSDLWIVEPYVQMYLDSISSKLTTFEQNVIAKQKSSRV